MPAERKSRIYYTDFGCRLNQFETRVLQNNTVNELASTSNPEDADYIVINTCTVTNRADVKNRQAIRKARLNNPHAHIIVTGCYATTDEEALRKMPEIDTVISNHEKFSIPQMIQSLHHGYVFEKNKHHTPFPPSRQTLHQASRAYLKIQDGCNKKCSYCKIPIARGKGISRDIEETISETKSLIEAGFKEIILTGVNIGHCKQQQRLLNDLLKRLADIPGDHFYRISSIEPDTVDKEFLEILSTEKFARFLHIPLQSGSNRILKLMRRGHTIEEYIERLAMAVEKIPQIHLGTDIIAGFPGETEKDFEDTCNVVRNIKFPNIHIFPFSRRSGSEIDKLLMEQRKNNGQPGKENEIFEVHGNVVRKRIQTLLDLQNKNEILYTGKTAGFCFRAVIEKVLPEELHLVTENYLKGSITLDTKHMTEYRKGEQILVKYDLDRQFTFCPV